MIIVAVAAFFRLYRIEELTEFLGDQGRTGLEIYQAWQEKKLPLAGPTVLTGEHLGPAFYYLVGPGLILANFHPLGGAVAMAIYGIASVVVLCLLLSKLVSRQVAFVVSILYAISPNIVKADRTLWEPTLVPLFVLLFFLATIAIYKERRFYFFVLLGLSVGILVQLHYPNILFILLGFIFSLFTFFSEQKAGQRKNIIIWSLTGVSVFLLVLLPFLIYESEHGFEDLRGIFWTLLNSSNAAKIEIISHFFDYAGRLVGKAIPNGRQLVSVFSTGLFLFIAFLWKPNVWKLTFGGVFVLGVLLMSRFSGVVFDHYLNFLLPVPFILLALTFETIRKSFWRFLWIALALFLFFWNISKINLFEKGPLDIARTQTVAQKILQDADGSPFSFTIISSPSFSDLHYRYLFSLGNAQVKPFQSADYKKLFVICDSERCPTKRSLLRQRFIPIACFGPVCKGQYPTISLKSWELVQLEWFEGGFAVYSFQRT